MISSISKIHQDAIKELRVTGSVQNVRQDWSHKIYSNHFSVLASQALQEIDNKGFLHFWRLAEVGNLGNSEMDEIKTRRACSEGFIYLIIRGAERVVFLFWTLCTVSDSEKIGPKEEGIVKFVVIAVVLIITILLALQVVW